MHFITKIFRHTTLCVVYRTRNSLERLLKTTNPTKKKNKFQKISVYQLTCKDCGKKYMGQTSHSFKKKFKEHFLSFKNNNYNSKFSHLLETGHVFGTIDDMEILYFDKKGRHSDTIERYYISRETMKNNQSNDKHTITCNRIFGTIIKRKGHLTNATTPI
jgi:hypothetical protein